MFHLFHFVDVLHFVDHPSTTCHTKVIPTTQRLKSRTSRVIMVEINHSTSNNSSIKAGQLAPSTPVDHLPFTLLSNSSFNYLTMYPQIPARSSSFDSRAPRSRTTTETSIGSTLTSYTMRKVEEINRMSADHRLHPAQYLQLPGQQDGNGGKAKRVPAPQCPRVAERREGASLPRSPGMDDLAVLLRAEEMTTSPPSTSHLDRRWQGS
jgi:hypothetical protein